MMKNWSCRRLFVSTAPMNSNFCCPLLLINLFHLRNAFSAEARSQTLFSQFASSKLNMSEADITRMLKSAPQLQKRRDLNKVEQFFHFFKKRGFTEVQIANIMRLRPKIVGCAEKTMEPRVKMLEDYGFVGRNLAKLLAFNASILGRILVNDLPAKMEFLKNVFQSQDAVVKALTRAPRLVNCSLEKTLKPSLAFWEGWGFSGTELVSFLQVLPDALARTSLTPAQVDIINKTGLDKESKAYKYIVSIVAVGRVETLEGKIENLKLCGLLPEEVWQLVGACPHILCYSKESVREKMNFIVNNMELPANYVVKHRKLLQLNLDKTMRPRFVVWQKVKSINSLELSLLNVLTMPETKFISKIIEGHSESKTLWAIYENVISNAPNRSKSSTKNIMLDGQGESRDSQTTTN